MFILIIRQAEVHINSLKTTGLSIRQQVCVCVCMCVCVCVWAIQSKAVGHSNMSEDVSPLAQGASSVHD